MSGEGCQVRQKCQGMSVSLGKSTPPPSLRPSRLSPQTKQTHKNKKKSPKKTKKSSNNFGPICQLRRRSLHIQRVPAGPTDPLPPRAGVAWQRRVSVVRRRSASSAPEVSASCARHLRQSPTPPNYILFCCEVESKHGGATPIIPSVASQHFRLCLLLA